MDIMNEKNKIDSRVRFLWHLRDELFSKIIRKKSNYPFHQMIFHLNGYHF